VSIQSPVDFNVKKLVQTEGLDKLKQAIVTDSRNSTKKKLEPHHKGAFVVSGYIDDSIFGYFSVINDSAKYLLKDITFQTTNLTLLEEHNLKHEEGKDKRQLMLGAGAGGAAVVIMFKDNDGHVQYNTEWWNKS